MLSNIFYYSTMIYLLFNFHLKGFYKCFLYIIYIVLKLCYILVFTLYNFMINHLTGSIYDMIFLIICS